MNCGYDGIASHCIVTNTPPMPRSASQYSARRRPRCDQRVHRRILVSQHAGHAAQADVEGADVSGSLHVLKVGEQPERDERPEQPVADKARAAFDRTHRLITNFDYQLPLRRAAGALAGWSLTGIVLVQTGLPMTLTDPNGGTVYGRAAASTVTMCPGATYAIARHRRQRPRG